MLDNAVTVIPQDVCLGPEKRNEVTTEGGLNVLAQQEKVAHFTQVLTQAGIRVSLFIDADEAQIQAAQDVGAPVIELHTGAYAEAHQPEEQQVQLSRIEEGAHFWQRIGFGGKRWTRFNHP